ncbi:MAG: beta-ketoacyl-ACP synthase II [Thermoflexales bacterium]|nr:beta-ketoacyl-ACP synthase II [Thermoflexales bacterium]
MRTDRSDKQRVVVTGMGAITPLGLTVPELWDGLVNGRSGIAPVTFFDASTFSSRISGEVKGFDPAAYMNRKGARRIARCSQLAIAALQELRADAGLPSRFEDGVRVGVLLGSALGGFESGVNECITLRSSGWERVSPFLSIACLPNMPAHHVSMELGAKGPNSTVVTACASGTQAIGEASEVIRRGAADMMISGGVDALVCDFAQGAFCAMRVLSTRNEEPEKASRPFDKNRDGFILSEGCGLVVLESLDHARQRGARIYAEVLGQAASCDAYHVAAPDPGGEGASNAMRWAMQDAGISPDEVDYINAHGPGTPQGDSVETLAIKNVLGQRAYSVPVSSTKSMIGHCMGGAGAIEAIACISTIHHGVIHPTINFETPDPACDLDYVTEGARKQEVRVVMSNSFGLGGQNACLVLGRME